MRRSLCVLLMIIMVCPSSFIELVIAGVGNEESSAGGGSVGVNYGRIANDLPDPSKVVSLLKSNGITRVKIFDTDSSVLTALAGSGISVTVCLPNQLLSAAAANQSFTDSWVQSNIAPFHPKTLIQAIAVGNEVFVDQNNTPFLVPAMKNVYTSLQKSSSTTSSIKVSSPMALSALQTSYPSSTASFKPDLVESAIKPMLTFLNQTSSPLMVNVYPFFAYEANTDTIDLNYALFRQNDGVKDPNNGIVYHSLFEAQLDAVYLAMEALNFRDVKLEVSETGWPSAGAENEAGAGAANAAAYNGNLVRRVLTGGGTPLRPNESLSVFLFALFNENQKSGPVSERNYGLFYPNEQRVYDIPLSLEALNAGVMNGSKAQVPVSAPAPANGGADTWCVANDKAGEDKLQSGLDYACGPGQADCAPIQSGASCFNPDTLQAHASYAFNSYYQKNSRATGTCDFGGAAFVVSQPPQFGNCVFPTTAN